MSELYNQDENIIKRYSFLYNYYGASIELSRAIDDLECLIQPQQKQEIWKNIFSGLKYSLSDDFDKSLAEFEKIEHSIEKNTFLHVFFQKEKLYSYVFSNKHDTDGFISSCEQLIDQYKDTTDELITWQVASLMLCESYCLWTIFISNYWSFTWRIIINEKNIPIFIDWVVILVCMCCGLIPFFMNINNYGRFYQSGIYVMIIG
jgi:hypothetical protein